MQKVTVKLRADGYRLPHSLIAWIAFRRPGFSTADPILNQSHQKWAGKSSSLHLSPGLRTGYSPIMVPALPHLQLLAAQGGEQLCAVRGLFLEYAHWLGVDLCFQGFEQELAALPGAYSPPRGRLLLAVSDGRYIGCIALRPCDYAGEGACEMKRLYVRPEARGMGLGRLLAERIIAEARAIGYGKMVLDTLATMTPAMTLYRSLGFVETAAYYANPIAEARYFALKL